MLSYILKCKKKKKDTEIINPKVFATSNGKTMILSKCTISGSKNLKSINTLTANYEYTRRERALLIC